MIACNVDNQLFNDSIKWKSARNVRYLPYDFRQVKLNKNAIK